MGLPDRRALITPRRSAIYAIVRTGGKQYRVEPDQTLDVDRLPAEVGSTVELEEVLLVAGDDGVQVGRPVVEGARVVAEVVEHLRGEKIRVFKYKNKTRYRRRKGHRQNYTRLTIRRIVTATAERGEAEAKPKRGARRPRKEAASPTAETLVEETVEATPEESPPAASRTRRPRRASTPESGVEGAPPEVAAEAPPAAPRRRTRKATAPAEGAAETTETGE